MDALLLSKYAINNYRPIPAANGKLKYLHDLVFGTRHEKKTQLLLWVPASNPYYKAGGVFESNEACNFSKIILFSSWEMVPRMISIMMSYYSELYTLGELKKVEAEIRYTSQKKNRYGRESFKSRRIIRVSLPNPIRSFLSYHILWRETFLNPENHKTENSRRICTEYYHK